MEEIDVAAGWGGRWLLVGGGGGRIRVKKKM